MTRWKIDRMEWISLIAVAAVTAAAAAGWSARNSLSVLVGGVMGLANLRLWRAVVQGFVARHETWKLTAGRLFLKLVLLAGVVWIVLRSSLSPLAVLAGFGSVIVGMLCAGWFPAPEEREPIDTQGRIEK